MKIKERLSLMAGSWRSLAKLKDQVGAYALEYCANELEDYLREAVETTAKQIDLPEWGFCAEHVAAGTASALEKFIYVNEPAGKATDFRAQLRAAIEEERGRWESEPCQCFRCTAPETDEHCGCEWTEDGHVEAMCMEHWRYAYDTIDSGKAPPRASMTPSAVRYWTVEEMRDGQWTRNATAHAWAKEEDARSQCEDLRRRHGGTTFRVTAVNGDDSHANG